MARMWFWFVLVGILMCAGDGFGQYPRRPAISSYLENYVIRPNSAIVDRYNAYQRPAQQAQRAAVQQGNQISQLRREVSQQGRESSVSPTGVGGTFMNFSHYFPQQSTPRRR